MTSVFKSYRSYLEFSRSVRTELRYVRNQDNEDFLITVLETSKSREVKIKEATRLWRAQLGHGWRTEPQDGKEFELQCPHPPNRMKPLQGKAFEGRANPKGIPYLYLSTTKETAMSEIRPWIGSYISVGLFESTKELRVVDCSRNRAEALWFFEEEPDPAELERIVWADIDRAFAEPVERSDDDAEYAPTQIISELFKSTGYDEIAYKSSFGEKGYNVALFDLNTARLRVCHLFGVKDVHMDFSELDSPYYVIAHEVGRS